MIAKLEKRQRVLAGQERNRFHAQYRMAVTDPPSTSIHISAGMSGRWYGIYPTPAYTVDLANYDDTGRRNTVFVNPYWYSFYWMAVDVWAEGVTIGGGADIVVTNPNSQIWFPQFETAVEAEQEALGDCWQLHNWPPWDYGPVLGCVILRNDGNTADPNRFMAVDPVNRGRSYIFRTHANLAPVNVT